MPWPAPHAGFAPAPATAKRQMLAAPHRHASVCLPVSALNVAFAHTWPVLLIDALPLIRKQACATTQAHTGLRTALHTLPITRVPPRAGRTTGSIAPHRPLTPSAPARASIQPNAFFLDFLLPQGLLDSVQARAARFWHAYAVRVTLLDFSKPGFATPTQPAPTYSSRAMAIVHLAMYDAFVTIAGAGPAIPAVQQPTHVHLRRSALFWRM